MAALSESNRAALRRELNTRFGPDADHMRDQRIAARARARGTIRSEPEYRAGSGLC
jgi:hypothetical protein